MRENDQPLLCTPQEASRLLGTSIQTLAKWRCYGLGPEYVKLRGRVFYERAALGAFVAASRRRSTSERPPAQR